MALDPLASVTRSGAGGAAARMARDAVTSGTGAGFADQLGSLINGVEQTATDANQAVTSMVENTGEVHDAMIALQRAEMALELTVQIRNKFVQAYQDIMRMPI